jgi:hypothetical protein
MLAPSHTKSTGINLKYFVKYVDMFLNVMPCSLLWWDKGLRILALDQIAWLKISCGSALDVTTLAAWYAAAVVEAKGSKNFVHGLC